MKRETTRLQQTCLVFWGLTIVFSIIHSLVYSWEIVGTFSYWEFGNDSLALLFFLLLTLIQAFALFSKNDRTRGVIWIVTGILKVVAELFVIFILLDVMNFLTTGFRSISLIAFYSIYAISSILDISEGIAHGVLFKKADVRKMFLIDKL